MTDDDQHVKENFATGLDEVRCPNTMMSTWRYCPYCGENIEDCPHERVDGAVENRADSDSPHGIRNPEIASGGSARSTDAPNDADDVDPAAARCPDCYEIEELPGTPPNRESSNYAYIHHECDAGGGTFHIFEEAEELLFTAAQIHDVLDRLEEENILETWKALEIVKRLGIDGEVADTE